MLGRFMNPNDSRSDVNPGEGDIRQEERILVWNVREAGNKYYMREFKEHIRSHKPQLVALLETHISGDKADRVCRRSGFDRWHHGEPCGFRGGIWILWDSQEIDIEIVQSEMQFITMWVTYRRQTRWLFTIFYASPHQQ